MTQRFLEYLPELILSGVLILGPFVKKFPISKKELGLIGYVYAALIVLFVIALSIVIFKYI
ncbi:hypothetical protein A3B18_02600 [Candidatus Giovannonibacteria bacterium RIFCSPLOWO2_01_FULL_46_13]|uniref:Uncharacterized protein n=1 Tax=Candidatus Giovannonibacteria bacterium RIFCSPLOWO2_01_FULL_46_13 TaxID=1798352 RepID=A0A1F5X5B3_9BACT|nr:MAG: hypothetical protein A3B18_02600 [Candidatus Giovannonibacteria bacterium RIFCSPLOWO2_01_FULL_46_13]